LSEGTDRGRRRPAQICLFEHLRGGRDIGAVRAGRGGAEPRLCGRGGSGRGRVRMVCGAARRICDRHGRRGRVHLHQAGRGAGARPRRRRGAAERGAERAADGPGDRAAGAPGAAAARRGLSDGGGGAGGGDRADGGRAAHRQALGRDLQAGRRGPMTVPDARVERTGTDPDTGYSSFRLGSFTFRRDEYFAHVGWPKGSHIIEVDRFLRAMVRDIGWGFFYGWIFFDDIFGTTNHYGTVDLFAGAYDAGYKAKGLDHLETFPAEVVKEAFETISQNWINEGYDPLRARLETGSPLGPKTVERTDDLVRGF